MTCGFAAVPFVNETLLAYGIALVVAGIGGGLFLVPLAAFVQRPCRWQGEGTSPGSPGDAHLHVHLRLCHRVRGVPQ